MRMNDDIRPIAIVMYLYHLVLKWQWLKPFEGLARHFEGSDLRSIGMLDHDDFYHSGSDESYSFYTQSQVDSKKEKNTPSFLMLDEDSAYNQQPDYLSTVAR
ncbi:unnamed protein product [Parnassius apollo]|uniref:(apollo) hypothetical protein n=1 Tax=Parnassius apollo TaxID=110799 RepID=A0A8S3X4U9_PARAO|nr:unnamed protein product [Parnassius apollo]